MKVLLLGGTGQIGGELRSTLAAFAEVVAPTRTELDAGRMEDVASAVARFAPGCVVNAAAYTRVDDAERNREAASVLNTQLPGTLASACERLGVGLIHISTDYVFPGDAHCPYREHDATGPINWYGETKLAGELAALQACSRAVIVRTSWIYGRSGRNFFRTVLRQAREKEELRVVDDQRGSPTWSRSVAVGISRIVHQLRSESPAWEVASGVYHMTAKGDTSWFGFAEHLLRSDPDRSAQKVQRLIPIAASDFPTLAKRPAYSVLSCDHLADRFGIALDHWQVQLEAAWSSH